jgi:hypothetical protein
MSVYCCLLFAYKYFHQKELLPVIFHDYFTVNSTVHKYSTRAKENIQRELYSTSHGIRCISNRASILWNELSTSIQKYKLNKYV